MKKTSLFFALIAGGLVLFAGCGRTGTKEASEVKAPEKEVVSSIDYNLDLGGEPWVLDIEEGTLGNENYRTTVWTGNNLQLVFMTLKPGEVIDLEVHDDHDQFFRVEQGEARVLMGISEDDLSFDKTVYDDWSVLVPAGYWHKVENTGTTDLKLYTLYAPPEHDRGNIHKTYEEAEEAHQLEHGD